MLKITKPSKKRGSKQFPSCVGAARHSSFSQKLLLPTQVIVAMVGCVGQILPTIWVILIGEGVAQSALYLVIFLESAGKTISLQGMTKYIFLLAQVSLLGLGPISLFRGLLSRSSKAPCLVHSAVGAGYFCVSFSRHQPLKPSGTVVMY